MIGIPQGSVLSALLCSFFYGDLERRHLKFTDDPRSVSTLDRRHYWILSHIFISFC